MESTQKNNYKVLLQILIIVILIIFLAAILTLIAKQFATSVPLEGYTSVPQQFTPAYTKPSNKAFSISGATLHTKLSQLPTTSYRPPLGAILSFPFLSPKSTLTTINGVVYATCNGQKVYTSKVAPQLQTNSPTFTVPDLRNKTLKQLDKSTTTSQSPTITVYPYGSQRTDETAEITKQPSDSTAINSNNLLTHKATTSSTLSSVVDDH